MKVIVGNAHIGIPTMMTVVILVINIVGTEKKLTIFGVFVLRVLGRFIVKGRGVSLLLVSNLQGSEELMYITLYALYITLIYTLFYLNSEMGNARLLHCSLQGVPAMLLFHRSIPVHEPWISCANHR